MNSYRAYIYVMLIDLIISALFITGLYTLCLYEEEGMYSPRIVSKMPLWFFGFYSKKYFGIWSKPLFTCNVCMSSFWGIVFYLVHIISSNQSLAFRQIPYCIIFIIALTGINKIIYEKYLA